MTILIDTREQKPLWSRNQPSKGYMIKRATLNVGDYTTTLLLNKYHIERKSLQDLYGTLIHNHPRFRREILRAEDRCTKLVVVVEGSHADFINKRFPKGDQRKATTSMLRKIIATIKRRYKLEIVFCSDRIKAQKITYKKLSYEERKETKKTKGKRTGLCKKSTKT